MNLAAWTAIGVGMGAALAASMGGAGFVLGLALGVAMWLAQAYGRRRRCRIRGEQGR